MTGYTVHTGSTEKFAAGWDEIFKAGAKKVPSKPRKTAAKKKSAARGKGGKHPKAK